MLHSRLVPLQAVNDVRDRAEAEARDSDYARGVLETLLWLNGDGPSPFFLTENQKPEPRVQAQIPGTLTTHGIDPDPDVDVHTTPYLEK